MGVSVEKTATLLELTAELVEADHLNVLDALRVASGAPYSANDLLIGAAYYALLRYLPDEVDMLAPWSDANDAVYVGKKLRACARTLRRGGPAHVEPVYVPATRDEIDLVERTETRNRKPRRAEKDWPVESRLQMERGRLKSALARMRVARHPDPAKVTAAELRLQQVNDELATLAERGA